MSEKHLSQELLTLEGVEKSGFLLLVTLTRCASRDAFPKSWNPLFSTPSKVKGSCDPRFSLSSPRKPHAERAPKPGRTCHIDHRPVPIRDPPCQAQPQPDAAALG